MLRHEQGLLHDLVGLFLVLCQIETRLFGLQSYPHADYLIGNHKGNDRDDTTPHRSDPNTESLVANLGEN